MFDAEVDIDADALTPFVTWGTNPGQGLPLSERVPDPERIVDENERVAAEKALTYMGLTAGTPLRDIARRHRVRRLLHQRPDRGPARRRRDHRRPHASPTACACWWCPARCGCASRPRHEGLDKVFTAAGAEWRSAGCSMCLGMNPDQLAPGERSASTSNRNFEGRQGKGGRTHLVSPLVAAATAVRGTLSSARRT